METVVNNAYQRVVEGKHDTYRLQYKCDEDGEGYDVYTEDILSDTEEYVCTIPYGKINLEEDSDEAILDAIFDN